ncbi:GNAT family N-acetyltransferase [Corynebacterium sp. NML180780]|uniref:N-acetylglutamate synthase, CG3035 family n=1 Tax=Corynebacterium sp. NML180780 TaxID=2598459 RepID=UPI00119637CC|nr:GNAT family N-acetyltransferase [Corynebacterium sp. NML180780]TVX76327.1 GNAT family N-acetyltransferase [Corynebacterium sp. NML180780]
MSRIFRSDEVAVGDRVVVRQRRGEMASDVIGHVLSLNPLVIRPQEVGGFPSFKDAVEIRDVHIIKKLSPRTVRNSDIRAIETATARAFPGQEQQLISGWLARSGAEIAERSNSAAPIGHSASLQPVPLDALREFYAERDMPVQLLVPERIGKPALRLIEGHQDRWELGEEILVMTAPCEDAPAEPAGADFRVDDTPDADWLSMYHFRGAALPEDAVLDLASHIEGRIAFARLERGGRTVAVTRATLTESDDGRTWLGYSAVEVAEDCRRQGLGTQLTRQLLAWGAQQGAERAYLQARVSNTAALAMYHKLGFLEHHRHRYARLLG